MLNDELTAIRLLLVEDHPVVRTGLRTLLEQCDRFHVVGEADNCSSGLVKAVQLRPDVVLLDFRLPDGSGASLCSDLLKQLPATKILFLTSFGDDNSVIEAILAGAHGYILKEIGERRLRQAVELVFDGHSIFDQSAIARVRKWLTTQNLIHNTPINNDNDLSPQQFRVLALVAEGKTNKEIARDLVLSEKTVRNYLAVIFEKLQITRRTEAAVWYSKYHGHGHGHE